ncbi:hypothetical protein GCM10010193_14190 [Kitasatospora atroaurantiaca]
MDQLSPLQLRLAGAADDRAAVQQTMGGLDTARAFLIALATVRVAQQVGKAPANGGHQVRLPPPPRKLGW